MATVRGGTVLAHVQAFADEAQRATGVTSFGTYPGHSPDITRALDIFVPVDDPTQGYALCTFALDNWERFGLTYIIFRQRIHSNDQRGWRQMEDRGNPTQNHFDHVHASFEADAPTEPEETELNETQAEQLTRAAEKADFAANFCESLNKNLFEPLGDGDGLRGLERFVRVIKGLDKA